MMRARRQSGWRRSGVTLIELLIVILVMLMITAVTVAAISPALEGRKLREAARIVDVFLNGARNRAIGSGKIVGVLIEPDELEPSQCIALSYVEQPDPYGGDYQTSTILTLGTGGFGAWQILPQPNGMGGATGTVASNDTAFPKQDVGWIQNIAPGDIFTLGNNDTVQYRLYLGEPFIDVDGNGSFTQNGLFLEPFNDVDGDGFYTPPPPLASGVVDPKTGYLLTVPKVIWGQQTAFVTYTYADPSVAIGYMSQTGRAPSGLPFFLLPIQPPVLTYPPPAAISVDTANNGTILHAHQFQFIRRPVKSSSVVTNLPDSTCIDLGSNYVDPATSNIAGAPGSGLDNLIPFSTPVSSIDPQTGFQFVQPGGLNGTLGRFASFRPNPLTDHEVMGTSATPLPNRAIMITFAPNGSVDRVYSWDEQHFISSTSQNGQTPILSDYQGHIASGPIYLLIGQRELVDGQPERLAALVNGTAPQLPIYNFQDPTSLWVAINPRTGLVSTTENVTPDLTLPCPTTQTPANPAIQLYFNAQVYAARTLAREASDMGGM